MIRLIDLSADVGEGFGSWQMGDDATLLPSLSSANVACGFHAGDPQIMFRTAALAREKGVAIGAHPGFDDLWGFGRRVVRGDSAVEIERMVAYQIGALQALAALAGHRVTYVKAHGALNNMANEEPDLARAIARAIRGVDRSLYNMVMPGLAMERASEEVGVPVVREIFADRTYEEDGQLTSRKQSGAVIHDPEVAAERVAAMIGEGAIVTVSGRRLPAAIDTVCVHGDNPSAVTLARRVRARLEAEGVTVRPAAPP